MRINITKASREFGSWHEAGQRRARGALTLPETGADENSA
jgi:hypothetical protein